MDVGKPMEEAPSLIYRMRAIITRGLYFFPHFSLRFIFKSGLYCREVSNYMITFSFKVTTKKSDIDWKLSKKKERLFFPCFVHPTPFVVCVFASLAACQVMADMERFYNNLIICYLYLPIFFVCFCCDFRSKKNHVP